jgi:hypothetical protein
VKYDYAYILGSGVKWVLLFGLRNNLEKLVIENKTMWGHTSFNFNDDNSLELVS